MQFHVGPRGLGLFQVALSGEGEIPVERRRDPVGKRLRRRVEPSRRRDARRDGGRDAGSSHHGDRRRVHRVRRVSQLSCLVLWRTGDVLTKLSFRNLRMGPIS